MKIKKLDIIGFKSFQDKACIEFPPGISAIVGPNGCGKSNVIDALRWVMGEQSVKQLRGKSMEDIIFAGANNKAPLNMAEVTLTLANDNGHAPEEFREFSEISVTRRLFRSGESAYLINKQPCRLKDIYNLFMGSGVGTRTFAIIQQGNIGAIIDAGPDERRLFIEEAAGVTRYKFRKNEALRKLKATEQNLLRINDIVSEVNRQMAGLRRQAKKAERFKIYRDRIRQFDTRLLLHYHDDFNTQINNTCQLLKELKDTDINHVTQLKKIDAAVEDIKLKRWQKNQEISVQKSDKFETQRKIDRFEADRSHLKTDITRLTTEVVELDQAKEALEQKTATIDQEIHQIASGNQTIQADIERIKSQVDEQRYGAKALQDRMADLNRQLDSQKNSLMTLIAEEARYKNTHQNASNNKENVKRRLKRIDEEVATASQKVADIKKNKDEMQRRLDDIQGQIKDYETQISELKNTLNDRSTALGAQVKKNQKLELERNKVRSQLGTLKKMAANYEWYRDGVKAIMHAARGGPPVVSADQRRIAGIIGLVADIIEPAPGYETAVEAVLGETLQYVLVQDQQSGTAAIDYLQSQKAGRGGFIPQKAIKPLTCSEQTGVAEENRLLNHVSVTPEHESIGAALLGHVAVVDTLGEALALHNRNGRLQTIVTRQGDVISHQGVLIGGSQDQLSGILAKKQELKSLEQLSAQLDDDLRIAQEHQYSLEEIVRTLETKLQQHITLKNQTAEDAVEAEKALYRISEDLKNSKRHQEIVELEQEQLMGEESELDEQLEKYNQALSRISSDVLSAQNQTSEISQKLGQVASQLESHNQQVVDLKLELTALHAKYESGAQTLTRLKDFSRDSQQRLEQLAREIKQKEEKNFIFQEKLVQAEKALTTHYAFLKQLEDDLAGNEAEYNSIDAVLQQNDVQVAAIQSEREQLSEKIRVVEIDLSEKRIRRDNIIGKVQERYHCAVEALRHELGQGRNQTDMTIREIEKELERFRTRISRIGDVNVGAINEYEELKKRFEFLSEQRDDLLGAIDDLHKVIRKINRITQQRFIETFEQVNQKLQEVFPKLFEGGSARLELSEPSKPLETGVEFLVHPPGKKLTRMSLLSGGEKALSAIAFIFAIFLIRPASFCLLDEIDAPLDEANVIRFNNLMQVIGQKSQIIMITHNKKSMEFADTLFGVTMEQKGISKVVSVNLKASEA